VFDRFSEDAKQTLVSASRYAVDLGHDGLGTEHLLLGLLAVGGSGAEVPGISVDAVKERIAADRVVGARTGAAGHLPFSPGLRSALEQALRESLRGGDERIEPRHLLLGALATTDGGAAATLTALGVDVPALHARLARPPATPTLPDLPDAPPLPGRGALARWFLGVLLAYAVLATPIVLLARSGGLLPAALAGLVGVPAFGGAVGYLVYPVRVRQVRRRIHGVRLAAANLETALAACGVSSVEVYAHQARVIRDRAFGLGRHGFVALSYLTLRQRAAARFVVTHEAGHVARRDAVRGVTAALLAEGLLVGGLFTGRLAGFGSAAVAAAGLLVAVRWVNELSCDTLAVRWAGPGAAAAWRTYVEALLRAQKRTPGGYLRRATAWTHHPPLALRERAWRRAAGVT
jgi:Zn-dependent protease with chaperone function